VKRSPIIVILLACGAGAAIFLGAYHLSQRFCQMQVAHAPDQLEWLRHEFQLSDAEMARVRKLHDGYLPRCAEMCEQIAAKKRELETALAGVTNVTATVAEKLSELGALRTQCQKQMLQHFAEVAQAMPPEPGRRYLAEMQRYTLGFHEQIEQSMSKSADHEHGHN
jgi:hypothetical protein